VDDGREKKVPGIHSGRTKNKAGEEVRKVSL